MRDLGRSLGRACVMALALVLLDFVVGRGRSIGPFPFPKELESLSRTILPCWVGALAVEGLGLVTGGRSRAATLGRFGLLLGTYLDLVFLRWDRAMVSREVVLESLPTGIACGLLVFLLVRRVAPAAKDPKTMPGWFGSAAGALLAALFAAPLLLPAGPEPATPGPPSTSGHRIPRVLLIVVDTLRADALSHAGGGPAPTPKLDAFARESHRFRNARVPSGWTLPSMVSIHTGVSPFVHRATERNSRVPDEIPTLAEAMSAAGYRTGAIGHNGVLVAARKLDRGFHSYRFRKPEGPPARSLGILLEGLARGSNEPVALDADQINALAFEWLEEHHDEDFFLWLHYYDPHVVYEPPVELRPEGTPPPGMTHRFDHEAFKRLRTGFHTLNAVEREWVRRLYDAEVAHLDRAMGELFGRMRELGIYEDTLILFTSDHGEEFWEHESFEHGHTLYDELLRVPLLVRLPDSLGATGNRDVDTPVSLESVPATVMTLCGIDHDPTRLSATSLFEADGTPSAAPSAPHASVGNLYFQDRSSVIFGDHRYKYVVIDESDIEELYDLEADPGETGSLVTTHPELLVEGRRRLQEVRDAAAALRKELGVEGAAQAEMDPGQLQHLKDIGYGGEEE